MIKSDFRKIFSLLSALAALLILAPFTAKAEDVVLTALLSEACAPWDGEAMRIKVALPEEGMVFKGIIWGEGLEALKAGTVFTLDGSSSRGGTGYGNLCNTKASPESCEDSNATIQIPAGYGEGLQDPKNQSKGTLTFPDDTTYEITPQISETGTRRCG